MEKELVITSRLRIATDEFEWSFVRSAGPGGQNVNKVNSKAVLRWPVAESASLPQAVRERFLARYGTRVTAEGDLLVTSQRYRDQGRNVEDCLAKLSEMVRAVAAPPVKRKPPKVTRTMRERRLQAKREHSEKKQRRRTDF